MSDPLITVVKLNGVLTAPQGRAPAAARRGTLSLDRVEKWLNRAFLKELQPAACAISINSPGGSPVQSELIHDMICRLKRQTSIPVFTFAEDVAASGGYWLLCSGDEMYGCSTSLVGSIGVVSSSFGVLSAAEKLGIERRVWTAGKAKVPMDPFLPVTEEQENRLKDIMASMHGSFQRVVRDARGVKMSGDRDTQEEIFSGRAWTGEQAVGLGLLDGIGTLRGVMREKFGEKARFLLCSESPQPGFRDVFGLQYGGGGGGGILPSMFATNNTSTDSGTDSSALLLRAAVEGVLDDVEQRAIWDRYKLS